MRTDWNKNSSLPDNFMVFDLNVGGYNELAHRGWR